MDILDRGVGFGGYVGKEERSSCWSPAWCMSGVLMSIQSLLDDPSTGIGRPCANMKAANMYDENRDEYYYQVQ